MDTTKSDRYLPVIQSIPHAGLCIPAEVETLLQITEIDLYNEADLWADLHFDFSAADLAERTDYVGPALAAVTMPVARGLIDVNRSDDDLTRPDGAVKSQTSYGRTIYREPLDMDLRRQLIAHYYQPFHERLAAVTTAHAGRARLFLDCHSMAQHGPTTYLDPGAARPLIMLANLGDRDGNPLSADRPVSCDPALFRESGRIAAELFSDLTLLEPCGEVPTLVLNWPFGGGPILRNLVAGRYSPPASAPIPGIMVEVNRGLFVGDQSADTPISQPNHARLALVRERLYAWAGATVDLLSK